jgi:hydrogenase expression/formation protein HypE
MMRSLRHGWETNNLTTDHRSRSLTTHCPLGNPAISDNATIDPTTWSCPLPLADYPSIVMGHGGGGKLGNELVEHLFLPAFRNPALENLGDGAILNLASGRIAMSTDSFVVQPLFFPGGNIGALAVNGTVNDLAVSGAIPRYLSASFILEEGFPLAQLAAIVNSMAEAARAAGVQIVTGDTKVVERGHGDGLYINTTGIGILRDNISVGPRRAEAGDVILVSGTIGDHGMAIMSVREGLEFESQIQSDCAALNGLIEDVLGSCGPQAIHAMRDPTRGGLASTLNEIATASNTGILLDEPAIPVRPDVRSACELLGLDPVYVANEGKCVFFVAPEFAAAALAALHAHPLGRDAAIIGRVTAEHPRMLVARTAMGATRVVPLQIGEQLPRIC